ncbi:ADP-ribosylglycohydrolase family protein [Echinicola soli]|uniref:ADP-ribosylglycohydrolase family protein n=1 Tax=Echinicola soli TaxID=2591634 RepID=A0A514CEE9_9BACT|nr:ADP-ribosylglycohydrolase family protein [Echinicola soli]QDH78195.1 ADP-ribosylglycohydrolase family protein [Echinicola soli]
MSFEEKLNKYQGCLLGGAVGDALGAPIEFLSQGHILDRFGQMGVTDYVEFGNGTGEFTDDTQMTLFTAEGLLRAKHRAMLKGIGGALHQITYHSYLRWLETQHFPRQGNSINPQQLSTGWLINQKGLYTRRAPGNTCLLALASGKTGTINKPINDSKGCGTIMRMAPVGLTFSDDAVKAFEEGCHLSAITHGHPSGYLSGGFFAALIAYLTQGKSLLESIQLCTGILEEWEKHTEVKQAVQTVLICHNQGISADLKPEDIAQFGEGWVAEEALAISLYCALRYPSNFDKGVIAAINHGGDSDSTGSLTGNILGLINGLGGIPEPWKQKLKYADIVLDMGKDLAIGIKGNSYEEDEDWWERYPGF